MITAVFRGKQYLSVEEIDKDMDKYSWGEYHYLRGAFENLFTAVQPFYNVISNDGGFIMMELNDNLVERFTYHKVPPLVQERIHKMFRLKG
jgi:hypothetical protein